MKNIRTLFTVLFASLTLFFSGCSGGDTHDKIADDAMTQMERMATAMGSIKDKASAEKAMEEFKSIVTDLKKIAERAKAIGKPSKEVAAKIEARMKAKQAEFQTKMVAIGGSIQSAGPEAGAVIMKAMQDVGPAIQELQKSMGEAN